ncbi:MAG: molybdopterin molybdenumtransferase MoeA [Chloroflexi bacterium]|nr:molybdopterin molybdenumtransferase MoeA [Chloroflexota bacterium]
MREDLQLPDLLNVDDAVNRILSGINTLPDETVPLLEALGRVLAEPVVSEISLPPFANSSMDGFAVRSANLQFTSAEQPTFLRVVMDIPAGSSPEGNLNPGQAARIMTGAPLPQDADAVVPVEDTDQEWKAGSNPPLPPLIGVRKSVRPGDYVRPIGEDIQAGQTVLTAGTVIRAQELGALAALGHATVTVKRRPRVAILSSGDELIDVTETLAPGKIRDVNGYTLFGLIIANGGEPIRIPTAKDSLEDVRRRFQEALDFKPDLVISSAGVSVGTFDVVREIMDELGKIDFWRVNLRPGKPLAYGTLGGVPFFGLPGNPVSAMVTFDVFVRPALLKMSGRPHAAPTVEATLREPLTSDGRRSYIRVKLSRENEQWVAESTGTQSSGALMSMVLADGLLVIPESVTEARAGEKFTVRLLRNIE